MELKVLRKQRLNANAVTRTKKICQGPQKMMQTNLWLPAPQVRTKMKKKKRRKNKTKDKQLWCFLLNNNSSSSLILLSLAEAHIIMQLSSIDKPADPPRTYSHPSLRSISGKSRKATWQKMIPGIPILPRPLPRLHQRPHLRLWLRTHPIHHCQQSPSKTTSISRIFCIFQFCHFSILHFSILSFFNF